MYVALSDFRMGWIYFRYLRNRHPQLSYLPLAPCIVNRGKEQLLAPESSAPNSTSHRYLSGLTALSQLEWRNMKSHH